MARKRSTSRRGNTKGIPSQTPKPNSTPNSSKPPKASNPPGQKLTRRRLLSSIITRINPLPSYWGRKITGKKPIEQSGKTRRKSAGAFHTTKSARGFNDRAQPTGASAPTKTSTLTTHQRHAGTIGPATAAKGHKVHPKMRPCKERPDNTVKTRGKGTTMKPYVPWCKT